MPLANLEKYRLDDDGEPGGVVGGFDAGTVRTGVGGRRRAAQDGGSKMAAATRPAMQH